MVFSYPAIFTWISLLGVFWITICWWRYSTGLGRMPLLALIAISLILLVYVPQLFVHKLRVDDQQMYWKDGYWWKPNSQTLKFDEVASVCTTTQSSGRSKKIIWRITYKTKGGRDILLSELLSLNASQIETLMRERGIVLRPCQTSKPCLPFD